MQGTRPPSVSADAQCIPPSITQPETIASIEASNAHSNSQALLSWARGMKDWATNAKRNHDAGQIPPPRPDRPSIHSIEVTYADQGGAVQTGPKADNGTFYAWIETVIT